MNESCFRIHTDANVGEKTARTGVFGDNSNYEDSSKRGSTSHARMYWTKALAFVSSEKKLKLEEEDVTSEDRSANKENDGEDVTEAREYLDHSEPSRPPSPRALPDEEDDYGEEKVSKPCVGGIGFKSATAGGDTSSGFGFGFKGGIGNKERTVFLSENDSSTSHPPTPAPLFCIMVLNLPLLRLHLY